MINSWDKLINGNDIRGVALEGIQGEEVNLTYDVVKTLGKSFAKWLSKEKGKKEQDLTIGIGRDSRLSGENLKSAAIEGMMELGVKVKDCDLASTPAMFMTTVLEGYKYDGAIMVTASHLPFNRNGLKFFTNKGALEKENIQEMINMIKENKINLEDKICENNKCEKIDFISVYAEVLVDKIRKGVNKAGNYEKPLEGFKIIVDAGNGSGGFYADKVLKQLGANTEGSQFLNPDGSFPNHIPNPENKEAMESIRKAVLQSKADMGIIFDTDVDRAAIVDKEGNEINRNRLIALISAIILEEHPNTTIVTDSVTSAGLKEFIEENCKGKHHRFKRGYKNVINEAIRLNKEGNETHLAIETSGHAALKENYFLDDGAYLVSKILVKMAKLKLEENKEIHDLIKDLKEPKESNEFRMKIKSDDFKQYGQKVLGNLKEFCKEKEGWQLENPNYEGVRVNCDANHGNGWLLMRLSLHDPVIPLNVETDSKEGMDLIVKELLNFVSEYNDLNVDSLKDYFK